MTDRRKIRYTACLPPTRNERLMERAGIGTKGAKNMAWFDNDRDTYQHHAEYLKRLNRLRDDLISQEQNNLANALDRLRMRSYGREYIFSRPKEKERDRTNRQDGKRRSQNSPESAERKSLLTSLQRFQQMRPKRSPPMIMPLEGRQILEPQNSDRTPHPRSEIPFSMGSIDESVRMNLQRLGPTPSIPRMLRQNGYQRDMVLESSQVKRSKDSNNSSNLEEKRTQSKLPKTIPVRNTTRPASEDLTLSPQTVKLEKLKDEDRMHLGTLRDYYCIYYIPPPSPSKTDEAESIVSTSILSLPPINSDVSSREDLNFSNKNRPDVRHGMSRAIPKLSEYSPPGTSEEPSMFISGNKMERHAPHVDGEIHSNAIARVESANISDVSFRSGRIREEKIHVKNNDGKRDGREKRRLIVEMPSIVCNVATPPFSKHKRDSGSNGLTKAFKQKELRQRELTNLLEDVKELNKRTENLKHATSSSESCDILSHVD